MADEDNKIRRDHTPELWAEETKEREERTRDKKEKAKAFLFQRQKAYQLVFNRESQAVQQVLSDLAKFCRASESTFEVDPRMHALLEGRREVFLRIAEHLELSSEVLYELKMRRGA